jgi:hypothetical protein
MNFHCKVSVKQSLLTHFMLGIKLQEINTDTMIQAKSLDTRAEFQKVHTLNKMLQMVVQLLGLKCDVPRILL